MKRQKQPSKLKLHRETLRRIDRHDLARVAGGLIRPSIDICVATTDLCAATSIGPSDLCTVGTE